MSLAPGARLGPYEIVSLVGAGGMGQVYRARDTRIDRTVAVKVLGPDATSSLEAEGRFEREARALATLNHPRICTLFEFTRLNGTALLIMEHLEGQTLGERLARGPLPLDDALRIGAEIADGLAVAHRAGLVHRDLKPANVMLTKTGAKLLDFGLAKTAGTSVVGDDPTEQALTRVGMVVGNDGLVQTVVWDSPAFKAGFAIGHRIVAVNGVEYSADLWRSSLRATAEKRSPLSLIVKQDKRYSTISLDYSGGLRYPRLEKQGEGESSLDRLLMERTSEAPVG